MIGPVPVRVECRPDYRGEEVPHAFLVGDRRLRIC